MANGTGAPPSSDPNDLLSQILATLQRMEAGGKGDGDATRGSGSRKGWQPQSTDFSGMTREVQDKIDRELKSLPAKYRNNLRNYTVEMEHPDGSGAMKRSWLHLNKSQPQTPWNTLGYDSAPTMSQAAGDLGAAALKPITASLALPIAMGFGDALGKSRGWRDMDDGLQRMARRIRESGGGLSQVASGALGAASAMATGPLAILGSLAASVGTLNQTATSMFKFQMSNYAPLSAALALTAARLDIGDIRRSQKIGGMIAGSADEMGLAMNVFKDQLAPIQAFGLNAMNKTMSFAMGAANQAIAAAKPTFNEIIGNVPAFAAGGIAAVSDKMTAHQKWSVRAGEFAWNGIEAIGEGFGKVFQFDKELLGGVGDADMSDKAKSGKQILDDLFSGRTKIADFTSAVGKLWDDTTNDPAVQAQLEMADKQNEARKAEAIRMIDYLDKISKEKPANVIASGMAQAAIESAKAAIQTGGDMDAVRAAGKAGMDAGMAAEEARMKEAEEADKEIMRSWVGRINEMSDWHLRNPAPLRAPVWQPNVVAARPPVAGGRRIPGNLAGRDLLFRGQPQRGGQPNLVPQPKIAAGILDGMVPRDRLPQLPFGPHGQRRGARGNPFGMGGTFGF